MMKSKQLSLRGMVYASMFGAVTAAGAYIIIPLQPAPITLQTLFLCLAGALLGGYAGALSQLVYVFLGLLGLPVFAGGKAGLGVLLGPTGGYLIGFIIGALVIGKLIEMKERPGFLWIAFSMLVGHLVLYTSGTLQLSLVAHLSPVQAILAGVIPFLFGDTLKIVTAAIITLKIRDNLKF